MNETRPKRLAIIYGTRPEAIKLAPLIQALDKFPEIETVCISTQQHSSLLSTALEASSVATDLEIDAPDRTSVQTLVSSIALGLESPIAECDAVIVQGDTVSAFAGALAGFLQKIPVIHLEAGLRTSTLLSPHPEEGLRRAISHITSFHLAPTQGARQNLESEGIPPTSIVVTGNTSIDAIKEQLVKAQIKNPVADTRNRKYCVVTVHRRENWGIPMQRIAQAISQLATKFPDVDFLCPLHPNPLVRSVFDKLPTQNNLVVMDPISHDEFVSMLAGSEVIFSDSGGIQEETTVLGIPIVILRDETERPEVIASGLGFIAGTDSSAIVNIGTHLLKLRLAHKFAPTESSPFGDGRAGERSALSVRAFVLGDALPNDMAGMD